VSGWARKRDSAAERARRAEYASPEYRAQRRAVGLEVAAGRACCWRCGRSLRPGSRWHLGHDDHDRSVVRGAECPSCNLRAAARKGARIRNAAAKAARAAGATTRETQVRL
jgi:hypothetical protein